MATFVLVHGAWSGAHTFRSVRPLLRRAGHEVFTPSLTGLGERAHLASPLVDLEVHVRDVANHIFYEDLHEVVLLGYSYGGMVVTGALRHIADRIRELVYLDAFVPADGQSLNDLTGAAADSRRPATVPGEWLVPPMPREWDDPAEQEWAMARRTAHPGRCFTEPVSLPVSLEEGSYGLTYVKAIAEPRGSTPDPFWRAADHARQSPRWRYYEIDTNHMIPENRPLELAELLTSITGAP